MEVDEVLHTVYNDQGMMSRLHHLSWAMDEWLMEGNREAIERLFEIADCDRLGVQGVIAILTDTKPSKAEFPTREAFAARAEAYLLRERPETAEKLMRGR